MYWQKNYYSVHTLASRSVCVGADTDMDVEITTPAAINLFSAYKCYLVVHRNKVIKRNGRKEEGSSVQYNARSFAALNYLRIMQYAGLTLPEPRPFLLHSCVPILCHCDAFVTNFTAVEFRTLGCRDQRVDAMPNVPPVPFDLR
ncbi:hypothetical protein EVAR_46859_1 [Eumeta japonica]|uniref:Uncharacterized protein n=1 Tax=Eumeta variegata TaxID=151549 RepID=A0A4C1XS70_EUMVA|nr:hypothetical protein EVAR_46859_1 [Eumeta japonica]